MKNIRLDKITIDEVRLPSGTNYSVLRLDRIHPIISGNKWYKLFNYVGLARQQGKAGILTFGGAYSNHIIATAAACSHAGLSSIGIIRGDAPAEPSSTLIEARNLGMQLYFSSREAYRQKQIPNGLETGEFLIVNEGGYGRPGAEGASRILDNLHDRFTHICCAVGTGTMMAGLINAAPSSHVIGFSIMKNNFSLEKSVSALLDGCHSPQIIHDYHFGGYGKHPTSLLQFMNEFYSLSNIPSDIVYTGKLFFGINDLLSKGFFSRDARILAIHSGGLQGNNSLEKGTLIY